MIDRRVALVIVLLGAACNSAKKDCEHARDVMVVEWERSAKDAATTVEADRRRALEAETAKEIAHLREVFVEICVAQPESSLPCVAKIDELLERQREHRAARDRCGIDDEPCRAAAKAAAETATRECDPAMDALMEAVSAGV